MFLWCRVLSFPGDQRSNIVNESSSLLGGSPRRQCGRKGSPYHTGQLHPAVRVADLLQHINQMKTAEGYGFKQEYEVRKVTKVIHFVKLALSLLSVPTHSTADKGDGNLLQLRKNKLKMLSFSIPWNENDQRGKLWKKVSDMLAKVNGINASSLGWKPPFLSSAFPGEIFVFLDSVSHCWLGKTTSSPKPPWHDAQNISWVGWCQKDVVSSWSHQHCLFCCIQKEHFLLLHFKMLSQKI